MERGYPPSKWDIQSGGSSSQRQAGENAVNRTVQGNMEEAPYNNILSDQAEREKLSQAYGRTLFSTLQFSQLQRSSSSMRSTSGQIPPPSGDEPRRNPFPTEFDQKCDNQFKTEVPKPQVLAQGSVVHQLPVQIGSSAPIPPITNLDADAIRQQVMLAGINALAMNNRSLQNQLLGAINSANANPFVNLNNLPILGGNVKCSVPDGYRLLKYCAPNIDAFIFDQKAGYKFDPTTGLHYDANSGLFINLALRVFLRWDPLLNTYVRVDIPGLGQPGGGGVGVVPRNSYSVISKLTTSALRKMNMSTGLNIPDSLLPAETMQCQAASVLLGSNQLSNPVNSSTPLPAVQDSFMNEIWLRMRALAKEAVDDSQITLKNPKMHGEAPNSDETDDLDDHRRRRSERSSSCGSHKDETRDRYKKRTCRCRSRSLSRGSKETSKGRKLHRRSRSLDNIRSRSRGRKRTQSRSPGRNRRGSHTRGSRRNGSRGRRSSSRGPRRNSSRSPGRIRGSRRSRSREAKRSRSRGRRSADSGARRGHSRRRRRSCSRGARRSRSKGVRRSHSRGRRSLSRGAIRSHIRRRKSISRSPGRHTNPRHMEPRLDAPKNRSKSVKRKADARNQLSPSVSPKRQHFGSTGDHRKRSASDEDISNNTPRTEKKDRGRKRLKRTDETSHEKEETQGDSDGLSDFDFLKETLDDDNESLVVDEYEEVLEYDASIFESKSSESRKERTADIGDVLGHLFTNNWNKFSNIILVAPVPLQDDLKNTKALKNQISDQEDVVKVLLFSKKAVGSPCHYMLIFFKTTEAATLWYKSNNGTIILNGGDGSRMRGYLHFAETGNWNCANCKSGNFLVRTLCHRCYQAKDNGYSPVSVAKEPTKWVGISRLKSCFSTTESVLGSLPSLDDFNIRNIQIITEPSDLPLGLCVFEVQSEAEGTRLHAFFRTQGRASIYVILNKKPYHPNAKSKTESSTGQEPVVSMVGDKQIEDPLAPLFADETPKHILLVSPLPLSKIHKKTKSETSLIASYLEASLKADGLEYNNISVHIDKNVGAPCSYGLISFPDPVAAADWRSQHDNSLNINIAGSEFPTSGEPSLKVFLHFSENNWDCRNCQNANFPFRSLCHHCFIYREENVSGPIKKSTSTTRWVATSKLTKWFSGNNCIVADLKNVMSDLKLTKIDVLRDPKCPVLPLACVFETESWGESLRLREFLHRTGRVSQFVTTNQCFKEFTCTDSSSSDNVPKTAFIGSDEATPGIVNNQDSNEAALDKTQTGRRPLPADTDICNLPGADVLEPDRICRNYLLWWNQGSAKYSDILNHLFVQNSITRVSPGETIFIGPLSTSVKCSVPTASALQTILTGKLEQDNLQFTDVSIHSGQFVGAPCTYALVSFQTFHDAESWHDKYKDGLILPRPQHFSKTPELNITNTSGENAFFKAFVYYCKPNWRCQCCFKINFGLRSNCSTCLRSKEPAAPVITFSDTPTKCVCIRKFKTWSATEQLLYDRYPLFKNHRDLFSVKFLKEESGIPLGLCILETNNISDAQLLYTQFNNRAGRKVVQYGTWHLHIPVNEIGDSNGSIEDELKKIFSDDSPTKILFLGPVPGLIRNTELFYKGLFQEDGADCINVECCLTGTVGAPYDYFLIHFNSPESAIEWHNKRQGRMIIKHRALPDEKFEPINPVIAFLHFSEDNWICDCGSKNFPRRSICFSCYKERNAESSPFIYRSSTPTKWLGLRMTQWHANSIRDLGLTKKRYNLFKIASVRLFSDSMIPKDNFGIFIVETMSIEAAVHLREFYKSSHVTHSADFVALKGDNTRLGSEVTSQVKMDIKLHALSKLDALMGDQPFIPEKKILVCPDYETIAWTSLFESRLNEPPTNIVMISLCPGDRELPDEARTQIQNSLQEAGVDNESILYSFKGDVGSPFSYCLVYFDSVDSAQAWVDKCNSTFEFDVPCPEDKKTPLNFQNCYLQKRSSEGGGLSYLIKSKLHYSAPNWLCSCGTSNFLLRSLCHNCFKNKNEESDYESVPEATRFVGIKLTEYRNLKTCLNGDLCKSGHKILKTAICFDPTLPRDPCGVVIFEVSSVECGTNLYGFLADENIKNTKDQNCKQLMMILEKSSGISYFKCPKSLEPKRLSENWDSFFTNETPTNVLAIDMDIIGYRAVFDALRQYGGKIKKCRRIAGFIPPYLLINFPNSQAAKEWYDANNGKLQHPANSGLHSLHFSQDLWVCISCSTPNFPARVLCHKCYRHKMNGFSPVSFSRKPTRFVGISTELDQRTAISSLIEDSHGKHEEFLLRRIQMFYDPNVRQDGTCILLFEVCASVEGLKLKKFFVKRGVKCSYFELTDHSKMGIRVQQSQSPAGSSEATAVPENSCAVISKETFSASELVFSDDILKSNRRIDEDDKMTSENNITLYCVGDPTSNDLPADIDELPMEIEGVESIIDDTEVRDKVIDCDSRRASLSEVRATETKQIEPPQNEGKTVVENDCQSEWSHDRLEEQLAIESMSNKQDETKTDCDKKKESCSDPVSQIHGIISESKALQEVQTSAQAAVNPASETHSIPNEPCPNFESQNPTSIPMDISESKALQEGQTSASTETDSCLEVSPTPNNSPRLNDKEPSESEGIAEPVIDERVECEPSMADQVLRDSIADDGNLVETTSSPSWIPPHPASAFVIIAPLTPRPSVNPNKDVYAQIWKNVANDRLDFKEVSIHNALQSGAPWHYSVVKFASPVSAGTWLEKRSRQLNLKQGARVKKERTVHLYFGEDDWKCACGITNYFERTFCHGCFMLKSRTGFSSIMQSDGPSLWVAIRPSNSAKNVDMVIKNWMLNLRKVGLPFVTEPTFHSDPGIKGGDMYGVFVFKCSNIDESYRLFSWFKAKHRAMFVSPAP